MIGVAKNPDADVNYLSVRNSARLSVVLNGFGGAAIILAILFFGGSFYVENEIGGIVLFGFAKVIDMLDAIRRQTIATQEDAAPGSALAGGEGGAGRPPGQAG